MARLPEATRREHHALANDIWRHQAHALDCFFKPQNVAVIGASEAPGSVGRTMLWNLVSSPFGGTVFPVNPKRPSVLGIKAYPTLEEVPARIDLAVVVTPAASVPGMRRICEKVGFQLRYEPGDATVLAVLPLT